jgi:GTPase SAR1 family protein
MSEEQKGPASFPKVRILVLGDAGVGKSTLVQALCESARSDIERWTHGGTIRFRATNILTTPRQIMLNFIVWFASVNIELALWESTTNPPTHPATILEFFDVGAIRKHEATRKLFYTQCHGILLCFDVTNRVSYNHLRHWIAELRWYAFLLQIILRPLYGLLVCILEGSMTSHQISSIDYLLEPTGVTPDAR